MSFNRTTLLEALHKGPCTVTFTKVNGEQRVMSCSLAANLLPTPPAPKPVAEGKEQVVRKESLETIRVFDLNKQEWRSFRVDGVTDFKEE